MRLVVVCLLLLLSPTLVQASGIHLVTNTFTLDPWWQSAERAVLSSRLQLATPCLACRVGAFASAKGDPAEPAAPPSAAAATGGGRSPGATRSAAAVTAPRRVIAIGDSWRLAHGREFSIRLTPTQEECAPLVRLKF